MHQNVNQFLNQSDLFPQSGLQNEACKSWNEAIRVFQSTAPISNASNELYSMRSVIALADKQAEQCGACISGGVDNFMNIPPTLH